MSSEPFRSLAIGVADVQRIGSIADAVARNLRITQCYQELARALASRTGSNAKWYGFATWASKPAGQTIRGEDLADLLDNTFRHSPALYELIQRVAERARALRATP